MKTDNQLYRFLFEQQSVRGEIVRICTAFEDVVKNHDYPAPITRLIGELMAATSLLTATLKFEGDIAVQVQGEGPVTLGVINGNHELVLRGVARFNGEINEDATLPELLGNKAYLAITITPKDGERYQGVVALDKPTLAECLENYFQQSEQLATRIWLFVDTENLITGGSLLQIMPESAAPSAVTNDFTHLSTLMDTITPEELFGLPAEQLLFRLYHEEDVRLFDGRPVSFHCGCSRQRCLDALITLDTTELRSQIEDNGIIEMKCEYCNHNYQFNADDIDNLTGANQTLH